MIALGLVLALLAQDPTGAGAREEARALLADVRCWLQSAELPSSEDVAGLRALAEELGSTGEGAASAEVRELVRELGNLGHRLSQGGRRPEGSALVRWSVDRAAAGGDVATEAWALEWLGQEAWIGGELDAAAAWLTRAAEVDRRRGAPGEEACDLADVARIRLTQGRLDESQDAATRAWHVAKDAGSPAARRSAAEILGSLWLELGKHRDALELCLEAAADEPGQPSAPDETRVRLEILAANVLADVGRLEAAAAHARAAHELALDPRVSRTAPLLHLEAKLSLGLLLGDLGRCDEALAVLAAATAEFERLGDERGRAWSAKNRGFALFAAGRLAEALPAFEHAWRAGAELGVPFLEGLGALGTAEALVLDEEGEDEQELARVEEALAAAERARDALHERTLDWRCAALRGRILLERGQPEPALAELARAVRLIERWRRRLGATGLVEHALRQRADPYRDAAFAAAALERPVEALRFAALLQARVLDELRARRSGPLPSPSTPVLDALREEAGRRALAGADPAALERAEGCLDAALVAAELAAGRRLVSLDERLDPEALGRGLAEQRLDLALVYLVGARETLVLRLEAGAASSLSARLLPVGRARCEAWIQAVREPIERLAAGELDLVHLGFDAGAARALHDALVRPLELPSGARVALVLDDVLASIPFELLVTGGATRPVDFAQPFAHLAGLGFLGDEHELVVLGSLARLLEPLASRKGAAVVLVAPDSAGPALAAAEALEIAQALPEARVEPDVRASDVGALTRGAALVHFAAHGRFDAERPAHGHLVLGGEEPGATARLESWQVAELDLAGVEVVLSACHSGRGAWRAGAGLAGLLRGFFLAGAREVVASQWAVDDRVTLRFMQLYYEGRARGEVAAEALRTTRVRLRAETDPRGFALAHPLFWAAWSLHR